MRAGHDLFGNGASSTYAGKGTVRNILCNKWTHTYTFAGQEYVQTWYFMVPEWSVRGLGVHEIPVRTTFETKNTSTLLQTIEFTNYYPNDPFYRREFILPRTCYEPFPQISLPPLPDQFRTTVSVSFLNSNSTMAYTEFVDEINNRLRIDFHQRNKSMEVYYDTKDGYQYTIDKNNRWSCVATPFNALTRNFFFDDGHLLSTAQLFRFGQGEVYDGKETIRGIECERWVRNFQRVRNFRGVYILFQYRQYFYFSASDWSMVSAHERRVPVRSHMISTALNGTNSRPGLDENIVMEYTHFYAGNMTGDDQGRVGVWHIPEHCIATFKPIPLPKLSPVFEVNVDISTNQHTYHLKEFRDEYNDRSRFETRGENGRNVTLFFLDKNVKFQIQNGQCQRSDVTKESIAKEGYLRLLSSLVTFEHISNVRYLGKSQVREINCDRWWLNFTSDKYYLINYYFSSEEVTVDRRGKHRVPIRFEIEGYDMDPVTKQPLPHLPSYWLYFDYSSYHTMQPPPGTFLEPSICLPQVPADAGITIGLLTLTFTSGAAFSGIIGFTISFLLFGFILRKPVSVVIPNTNNDDALVNE